MARVGMFFILKKLAFKIYSFYVFNFKSHNEQTSGILLFDKYFELLKPKFVNHVPGRENKNI